MYDQHFGLTGRPFQLTPDPAFWYGTATHRRAMAYLGYGLAQGEGFIVITGDIGAGKTTLVGHLLDTLDREALNPVHLVSTAIEAADLLRIVATQLGVDPAGLEKAQLLVAIERGLHAVARTGRRTLLIVDEAQALSVGALEELRMLSNFQAGGHALLQIVLLGQPEFREALHGARGLEQLRQRVIAIHHLDPMGAGEVAAYVRHRLSVVGWDGRPCFSEDAFAALHRATDGVPRRLNQLAHRVMLHAAIEQLEQIGGATVEAVSADLFADLPTIAPAGGEPASALDDGAVPASRAEQEQPPIAVAQPWTPEQVGGDAEVPVVAEVVADPAPDELPARPFRHSWLTMPAEVDTLAPVANDPEPIVAAQATPAPGAAAAERIAALEARIDEQDVALRRVLTLLVDWVESGEAVPRAAEALAAHAYAPIRGAAAA